MTHFDLDKGRPFDLSKTRKPFLFILLITLLCSIGANAAPTGSFVFNNDNTCSGTSIQFTSTVLTGTGPYTYAWDFGDGGTSTLQDPVYAYSLLGCNTTTRIVTLRITDGTGTSAPITNTITIKLRPDVQLRDANTFNNFKNCDNSPSPANPNYTLTVQNISPSAGCITSYTLDWGDGTAVVSNPVFPLTHTYTQLGAYNLVISAVGSNGCSYSRTYIVANQSNPAGGLGTLGNTTGLCAPSNVVFTVDNWALNSPGTVYNITFGDGQNVSLPHPLNATGLTALIDHIYATSSCPTPTYTANLNVVNACATTPYSAGNIQIRIKPKVNFTPPAGCVNQSTCFTNTTLAGYWGGACDRTTAYAWDFGDPTSTTNTSTIASPCHVYTQAGSYSVMLIATNPCGSDTVRKNICVTSPPVANFTLDNPSGCIPLAITATNTSTTGNACAPVTYAWSVLYTAGFCGTVTTPSPFTNGTNASSINPSFNLTNPGTYTIRLTVSNACGSNTMNQTVIVKKPPTVTLPAIANSCGPVTFTPNPTIVSCTNTPLTYAWVFTGGTPATSSTANPGPVSFSGVGTYSVSLSVTNECGTTTASQSFSIFQAPDVTVPPNDTLCRGQASGAFTFSSSITGTTYTWTNSNTAIGLGASGTGNIASFTAANGGTTPITGIITVTPINGCNGTPVTFRITVYPIPAAPTVTTPINYCQNAPAVPLTATAAGTNTLNWYTVATGGTPSSIPPTPLTTALGPTTYWVSQSNVGQCESPRAAILINVLAIPNIGGSTFVNPTSCGSPTGSITLTGLANSTSYTVKYLKNGNPVTITLSSNGSGSLTIPNLTAGTYTDINVTVSNCPSNLVGPISLSDPNPPATPTAGGNTPICSGGTLNLTSTTSVTGTITYIWTGPNTYSSGAANPSITNVTTAATGTYTLSIRVNGCTSAASTVDIVVNPTPAIPTANSNTPVCKDSTLQLNASTVTTGTITYAWTGPNSFTSNLQNPTITGATTAASGTYSVTATLGTCTSAPRNITVVINPTPNIGTTAFTNPSSCIANNGTITLNGLSASTSYTVKYLKNGNPITVTIPSNASGVLTITGLSAGTYSDITVTTNTCASNTVGPFTLVAPNPPATPVVTGNSPICAGGTLALTAATSSTGTATYNWIGPNSFISAAQNPSITNITAAASGTYSVTATINGCVSLAGTINIQVTAGIANNSISADQQVCTNTIPALIVGSTPTGGGGGNSYNWEQSINGGTNWTAIASANGKDYQPAAITITTIYRRYTNTTVCSGVQAGVSNVVTVTVNPDARAVFNPTKTKACAPFAINPAVVNLTQFATQVSEYRWYVNNVYVGSGINFPGYTIANPNDTVTIKLVAVARFGCKNDSMQRGFSTYPRPLPSFAVSDSAKCGPLTVTFTNTTPAATSYNFQWDFGNGQTSNLAQPGPITFQQHVLGGDTTYTVKLKAMGVCDTIVETHLVRIIGRPRVRFTPTKSEGCSPMHVIFTNTTAGPATYVWDFGDGSPTTNTDSILVHHTFHVGVRDTFYVKLKATNLCGTDSSIYQIIVNPADIRLLVGVNGTDLSGCSPHSVRYFNNSAGANTYNWNFGDGNTLVTTKGLDTVIHTYTLPGTYTMTLNATNTCTDTTTSITITVQPKPVVAFTANPLIACIGDTIIFNNQSTPNINYNWRFGDNTTSTLTNPKKTYTSAGTFRTWLIGSIVYGTGNSCSDSTFKDIVVRDTLAGDFTFTYLTSCLPATIVFKNMNRPSASTTWDFGDGDTGTGDSLNHTYLLPGTYTVKMISRGLLGCNYKATKTIVVTGPVGLLRYIGGFICLGDSKQFEIIGTGGTNYAFVFGDGDSLNTTSPIVSHTYLQPGTYVPHGWLFSGATCSLRVYTGDTVKVDRIKAGFKYTVQQSCGRTVVSFTDTSSAFFGIRTWQWDFGDASTAIVQNPTKAYTQNGIYQIKLRVVGASGCIDLITVPITIDVHPKPASTITGDTLACIGQPLSLVAVVQSQDPVQGYAWDFGNSTTGSGASVSVTYNAAGTYTVRLISLTSFGCTDTVYRTVRASAAPIVFAGNDVRICRGQSVQLNANGAIGYQWGPLQNLSCNTCVNPIANPINTTLYTVTGTNGGRCTSTDDILVTVIQPSDITVSNNDTICLGQTSQLFASGAFSYAWNPSVGLDAANVPNPIATPLSTTLYRVIGFDRYNCFSDTAFVRVAVGPYPTVDLGNGATVVAGTQVPINAIITNGPIKTYTWTPARDLSCTNCGNPIATINNNIFYKLEVENIYGCAASDTISFKVNCDPNQVFVPNAFSPDNDGINDILMVRAKGIAQVKYFRVFNRWGQLVFERSNIGANDPAQGWDGTVNKKPAGPDVYVFTAEVVCTAGGTFVYKGNVTLVR